MHLFFASFHGCGETNATTCLVTKEIVSYAAGFIEKLSLKRKFYVVAFTCFFN